MVIILWNVILGIFEAIGRGFECNREVTCFGDRSRLYYVGQFPDTYISRCFRRSRKERDRINTRNHSKR